MPWQKLAGILIAGGIGSLARYGIQGWVDRLHEIGFPFGTLAVNLLGTFLFGFAWSLAEERMLIPPDWRVIILTGFLGGFTTFSTFAFESGELLRESQWLYTALYLGGHYILGIVFVFLGNSLGRWI